MINSGRNSKSSRVAAYLAVFLILLSGCALLRTEERTPSAGKLERENLIALKAYAVIEALLPESGDKIAARAIVYLKLPDMARIEVMGPFNGLAVVIVSSGKDCSYAVNGEAKPCGGNTFFDAVPGSSVKFLMGSIDKADFKGNGRITAENGMTILNYEGYSLIVELSDYRDVRGISLPFSLKTFAKDKTFHIKYSSVELNPSELSGDTAGFFTLAPR
ncbi:MAG: hypothetical protein WA162_09490 [Thermodesulfobacteriota bacterium]